MAILLTSGCARGKYVTEIKADASWQRTDTVTGKAQKEGGMPGTTLQDFFVTPTDGKDGWKRTEEKKGADDVTLVFTRSVPAGGGAIKGDVGIKGDGPDKLSLVNQVTVTKKPQGQIEYREVLHWVGSKEGSVIDPKPEDLTALRNALPKALATDANAKALAESAAKQFIPMLFGPGDPLLTIGIMHPDLAERRLTRQIGASLDRALQERFGDKLSQAERRAIVTNLIQIQLSNSKPATPDPGAPPAPDKKSGSSSGPGLIPLIFVVHGPGRVVSTNGEKDEFAGEVYWALYPEAALLSDVVMTVVFDPSAK